MRTFAHHQQSRGAKPVENNNMVKDFCTPSTIEGCETARLPFIRPLYFCTPSTIEGCETISNTDEYVYIFCTPSTIEGCETEIVAACGSGFFCTPSTIEGCETGFYVTSPHDLLLHTINNREVRNDNSCFLRAVSFCTPSTIEGCETTTSRAKEPRDFCTPSTIEGCETAVAKPLRFSTLEIIQGKDTPR